MKEDREALDVLYQDILRRHPPGPERDACVARLRRMAALTDCPQWQPSPKRAQLTLCPSPSSDTPNQAPQDRQGEK